MLQWLHRYVYHYNLFIPDENDYDDGHVSATAVKHQRYATRLYIPLFIGTLYVLAFLVLINPQERLVTIDAITPRLFETLQREHTETLSCPCSNIAVPYDAFVYNEITYDSVCSSIFVGEEWISALYVPNASTLLVMDFRTTAYSQFKLLAAFCSICQDTVSQTLVDFGNTTLVTLQLLPEGAVRSQVDANIQLTHKNTPFRITLPLNFLQIATRANLLISALNTNAMLTIPASSLGDTKVLAGTTYYFASNASSNADPFDSPCYLKSSTAPAGFYLLPPKTDGSIHKTWPKSHLRYQPTMLAMVDGFFAACNPLEALLAGTLDCLYNATCLKRLVPFFPTLHRTTVNWSHVVLPARQRKPSVNDRLATLLVDQWLTDVNYSQYFTRCAPVSCSYVETDYTNLSYTIALLLRLYGGLTIVLRLLAVALVAACFQLKDRLRARQHSPTLSFLANRGLYRRRCLQWMMQLNLFKSAKRRTPGDIAVQRLVTRTYLTLLAISMIILLLLTSMRVETVTKSEPSPPRELYEQLQSLHRNALRCPCSTVAVPYRAFMSLTPVFHQVCSSVFVSDAWIFLLQYPNTFAYESRSFGWTGLGPRHFLLLASICQLANRTIDDAVRRLGTQLFITTSVQSESEFGTEVNAYVDRFTRSLLIQFALLVNTVHLFTQVDQPYTTFDNAKLLASINASGSNGQSPFHVNFVLTGFQSDEPPLTDCICATNPHCKIARPLYGWSYFLGIAGDGTVPYAIPGSLTGCFTTDSLLLSSLECYYTDVCLTIQYYYIDVAMSLLNLTNEDVHARTLVYNSTSSRFPPNTSLSTIVEAMLIERWNTSSSFDSYYEACAPSYCSYSLITHTNSPIAIVITILSSIGGLTLALRLITPLLVRVVFHILTPKRTTPNQNRPKWFDRMKAMVGKLRTLLCNTLRDLNVFPLRTFGSHVDRNKAKYLGQLTTRLYGLLLIVSFVLLALYTVIRPRIITRTFAQPSLERYRRLLSERSDTLQCPCSSISSTYHQFISVEPVFHPICSSPFASDQWRLQNTAKLVGDLSAYSIRDYRRFLSAHLQMLQGLCDSSQQLVHDTIHQSLDTFFVTAQLLSPAIFQTRMQSFVDQCKSNALAFFTRLLLLLRAANYGNAIVSAYGSNFEYFFFAYSSTEFSPVLTRPVSYDDHCSCASQANCTAPAIIIGPNVSTSGALKGLKMGCTPSESFLASTLECFYDIACLTLIQAHNYNIGEEYSPPALQANSSSSSVNKTVNEIVRELFVETWSLTVNYASYFNQCLPSTCSYTYVEQFDPLYTLIFLLGLFGGLNFVLKWICPNIVGLLFRLRQRYRKRTNVASFVFTTETSTADSTTATYNVTFLLKFVAVGLTMLILMAVTLVTTSVYLHRHG